MYVRVYGADMVCRLIETCFLIHILRSISKVLGASWVHLVSVLA